MDQALASATDDQTLVVRVGDTFFGLPGAEVVEVIRHPVLTRVPLSPPSLAGIANLRGMVLPVVSLAVLTGLSEDSGASGSRVVVMDHGGRLGLAVDEIASFSVVHDHSTEDGQPIRMFALDALLARDFDDRYRRSRARTDHLDEARAIVSPQEHIRRTLVSFDIAGQDYALPLDRVSEIVSAPEEIVKLARADAVMVGLADLRGRTLPLVAARALLGLPSAGQSCDRQKVVVLRAAGTEIGLLVDGMKDILQVPEDAIDPVPAVLTRGGEAEIEGICRIDGGRRLVSLLSPDRLLRDLDGMGSPAPADETHGIGRIEMTSTAMEQFLVFRLGGQEYGLPVTQVEEVVRLPDTLTPVPKAPAFVEGVMNLRGRVVPVIDQRQRFAVKSGAGERARVIVVAIDGAQAGFIVDSASEIVSVPAGQVRRTPELAAGDSQVIDRIATLDADGRMILLIDPRELLDRAEKDLLDIMLETENPVS